ncbi:MAG: hypothetical protein J0L72_09150 [Armatimonadetes bacterium]|nr:hypothetical protein [Armatimonadota bacterium]
MWIVRQPARWIWGSMLWFMRRGPVKHLRFHFVDWLPERKREGAWTHFREQERWARKNGLTLITVVVGLAELIILLQLMGAFAYWMEARGMFVVPER